MPDRRRRRVALGVVLLTASVAGGALYWWVSGPRAHRLDQAFSGETEESWPPAAPASLADELAATRAMRRIGASGLGPDASYPDAGLAPLGGDTPGLQVRTGWAADLYYIEAVFGDASFDDPMPMAVLIHGRGDRARIPGGPFWDLGRPIRVIVPQAPDPLGDGFEWLPVRVGQGLVDRLTTSLLTRSGQLASMLRELQQSLRSVGRTLVVGFSQGGMLTFTLAVQHSDVVQAAFPLSAWLPPALVPAYRRPDVTFPRIRGMHGTADRIIEPEPTEEVYGLLRERGFDAELVTFEGVAHTMSEDMDVQLHAWLLAELGAVVEEGYRRGLLDGGVPTCAPAGWPFDGGWPPGLERPDGAPWDGGLPEAGPLDPGFDAGPWWPCLDAGPSPFDAAADPSDGGPASSPP